jgi:hypothetical protein
MLYGYFSLLLQGSGLFHIINGRKGYAELSLCQNSNVYRCSLTYIKQTPNKYDQQRTYAMLTRTAKLSQSVLRCAIGLRKSGTVYSHTDVNGSEAGDQEEKKYRIYESSRYISRIGKLSRAGLTLLLYVHFCDPDTNGLIRYFDPAEAAQYIACTRRTVMNNLHQLSSAGFLSMSRTGYPGIYNLFISDYKKYFLPAAEGGTGYSVLHRDILEKVRACRDINEMRTALRVLFDQSALSKDRLPKDPEYSFYRNGLPKSITRGNVRDIVDKGSLFTSIFNVVPGKYNAKVRVKSEYDPLTLTRQLESECERGLVMHMNSTRDPESPVMKLNANVFNSLIPEIMSLKDLGQKYPVSVVVSAVDEFITDYILKGDLNSVHSIKAAIRNIAREIFHTGNADGSPQTALPPGYIKILPA